MIGNLILALGAQIKLVQIWQGQTNMLELKYLTPLPYQLAISRLP